MPAMTNQLVLPQLRMAWVHRPPPYLRDGRPVVEDRRVVSSLGYSPETIRDRPAAKSAPSRTASQREVRVRGNLPPEHPTRAGDTGTGRTSRAGREEGSTHPNAQGSGSRSPAAGHPDVVEEGSPAGGEPAYPC